MIELEREDQTAVDQSIEKCLFLSKQYKLIKKSEVNEDIIEKVVSAYTGIGYPAAAEYFVSLNKNVNNDYLARWRKIINQHVKDGYESHSCIDCGCDEKQIQRCFGSLREENGKITNSISQLVNQEIVRERIKFEDTKDEIDASIDNIIANNDTEIIKDEDFVKKLAIISKEEPELYKNIKEKLEKNKIPVKHLQTQVGKIRRLLKEKERKNTAFDRELYKNLPEWLVDKIPTLQGSATITADCTVVVHRDEDTIVILTAVPYIRRKFKSDQFEQSKEYYEVGVLIDGKPMDKVVVLEGTDLKNDNWLYESFYGDIDYYNAGNYKYLSVLIQELAKDLPFTICHSSIGWARNQIGYGYCYTNKCIGNEKIHVKNLSQMPGYSYIDKEASLKECYQCAGKMFDLIPNKKYVIDILLAYTTLSFLVHKLREIEIPPKALVWLYGGTGIFKTEIAKILISFFGKNDVIPASFNDTKTRIEIMMNLTKDALLLVDDYCPSTTAGENYRNKDKVVMITRNIGDRTSRGRMTPSMKPRPSYPPLGNVIITAEDTFVGASTISRHITLHLIRGDVDENVLSYLQVNKPYLAKFGEYYVCWLLENIYTEAGKYNLKDIFLKYRDEAFSKDRHRRFAETMAHLRLSMYLLTEFLCASKLIDIKKQEEMNQDMAKATEQWACNQNQLILQEDMADMFMLGLQELILSGQVSAVPYNNPDRSIIKQTYLYADADTYYLLPDLAYAAVVEHYNKKNIYFSYSDRVLWDELLTRKYCKRNNSNDGHAAYKIRKRIGGLGSVRTIAIPKEILNQF